MSNRSMGFSNHGGIRFQRVNRTAGSTAVNALISIGDKAGHQIAVRIPFRQLDDFRINSGATATSSNSFATDFVGSKEKNQMRLPKIGPGLLVTAAFIGPGTVTKASQAGASTGLSLLWVVVFSIIAAVVLQEMAARLGIVSKKSLSESVSLLSEHKFYRVTLMVLVLAAIAFGNAAYQAGNLAGAAAGMESIAIAAVDNEIGSGVFTGSVLVIMFLSGCVLFFGNLQWIVRIMMGLVGVMSLAFIWTAVSSPPNWGEFARGLFIPTFDTDSLPTVIGLIGTTVVPYNLFLHSQSAKERWPDATSHSVREARIDTTLAVCIGGLITAAIVMSSAAAFANSDAEMKSAADMATQLNSTLGSSSSALFGLGLFAAGLTSSITAPLAAAYVVSGLYGWRRDENAWRFRAVWFVILLIGGVISLALSKSPLLVIGLAQVANGLLLPMIAGILLWSVNRKSAMGDFRNHWFANSLGVFVILIAAGLGLNTIIAGVKNIM